ncbi:MAG TPA: hypothetical protein VIA62_27600 [Thermoanaerobaculia bacterium]|jgi:hypothetical protein|nr:hypothetical protein [Thermoanaerobaculia bacterium]
MGGDPEERTIEAKEVTRDVYDPVIDDVIEKTWTQREGPLPPFRIAAGGSKDIPFVWHNCVDWEGLAFRARKGDGVEIGQAYFEDRKYANKEGVEKTVRQIVVQNFRITRLKNRHGEADRFSLSWASPARGWPGVGSKGREVRSRKGGRVAFVFA